MLAALGFVIFAGPILIQKSVRLPVGSRVLMANTSKPAYEVRGNNITVDGRNFHLRGTPARTEPDQRKGLGFLVSGKNITIKNLRVSGYKIGLLAKGCKGLKLINCDFSDNWKQRLLSTPEQENEADWMSFHHNEKQEWMRYGAGVYLEDTSNFELKNLDIFRGQCGVMMTRCTGGLVWNSNISFNSGVGIGMYRSSNNRIMHNRLNYNVRGYSAGVYNRGQDSAAILVYEQSNKNLFAYNDATHSGDGFFLWAGQTTMDTGKGGSNDNLVYGNDFRNSVTNGIEATFSRNKFVNNNVSRSNHGFWTGYSFDSLIAGNEISGCNIGIAHEHGNGNTIDSNHFLGNKLAMKIWANEKQDPSWGYPKTRNTKSENWVIKDNEIYGPTLILRRTSGVSFTGNTTFSGSFEIGADNSGVTFIKNCLHSALPNGGVPEGVESLQNECEEDKKESGEKAWSPIDADDVWEALSPEPLKGGYLVPDDLKDLERDKILMDGWGPFTGEYPLLLEEKGVIENGWQKVSVLGPPGRWRLVGKGLETLTKSGIVPGSVWIKPGAGNLTVEYIGGKTIDYRGVITPAGKPTMVMFKR
jgi:parallel beta-helix repeat protein